MRDLVKRLRERAAMPEEISPDTMREAADALEAAQSRERAVRMTGIDNGPIAWRHTGVGFRRFITEERYRRAEPRVQRWYEPYHCAHCRALTEAKEDRT